MLRRVILTTCGNEVKKMKRSICNNRFVCNTLFSKSTTIINKSVVSYRTLYTSLRQISYSKSTLEESKSLLEEHNEDEATTENVQVIDFNTEISKLESSVYYGAADCPLTRFEYSDSTSIAPSTNFFFVNKQKSKCGWVAENNNNSNVDHWEQTDEHISDKADKDNNNSNNVNQHEKVNMEQKCSDIDDIVGKNNNRESINDQFNRKKEKSNKYYPRDFCVSALCEEGGCLWQWRSVFVIDQPFHNKKINRIMPTNKNIKRINSDKNQNGQYYSAHLIPFMITTSPIRCWEQPCVHRAALSEWLSHINYNAKENTNTNSSDDHTNLTNNSFQLSPSHLVIVPTAVGNVQAILLDFSSTVQSCGNNEVATCDEVHCDDNHDKDKGKLSLNEWYASYFNLLQYSKLKSTQQNKKESKHNKENESTECVTSVKVDPVECDKNNDVEERKIKSNMTTDNVNMREEQSTTIELKTNKQLKSYHTKQQQKELYENQCEDTGAEKLCTNDMRDSTQLKKRTETDSRQPTITNQEQNKLVSDKLNATMHNKANANYPKDVQETVKIAAKQMPIPITKATTEHDHDLFATEYCNVIGGGLAEIIIGADRYAALINRGEITFAAACWALLCDTRNIKTRLSLRTHALEIERELLASVTAHKHTHSFDTRTNRTLREQHELNSTLHQQQPLLSASETDRDVEIESENMIETLLKQTITDI